MYYLVFPDLRMLVKYKYPVLAAFVLTFYYAQKFQFQYFSQKHRQPLLENELNEKTNLAERNVLLEITNQNIAQQSQIGDPLRQFQLEYGSVVRRSLHEETNQNIAEENALLKKTNQNSEERNAPLEITNQNGAEQSQFDGPVLQNVSADRAARVNMYSKDSTLEAHECDISFRQRCIGMC